MQTSRVKPFSVADWPMVILRKKRSFVSITIQYTQHPEYIYVAFIYGILDTIKLGWREVKRQMQYSEKAFTIFGFDCIPDQLVNFP